METKSYQVRGMSCGGCAASVTRAIQKADDSAGVDVDLASARVTVTSNLSEDAVRTAVEGAGFDFRGAADPPS